jgi:hypothetical protein
MIVKVGSSFGLEPQQKKIRKPAPSVMLPNLTLKDGRYKLKVYQINKYQVASRPSG